MLRTNLSTRPFYNIRAVQVILVALGVIVLVMTLVNLVQLVRLMGSERALGARATQAETDAERLRGETARVRAQIDTKQLAEVGAAAEEAQAIIDLRVFSWSDLFGRLEATMPESVRLSRFEPGVERDGQFKVSLRVQARRVQDLESFLDALEKTGVFRNVLATEDETNPEGLINALVEGAYTQPPRPTGPAETPAVSQARGVGGE